ncbi:hypothetical protein KBX50_29020 [Micromonospora sp. C51]|uniref:hypothetical protein n=1 Tax=Micromonospora sp. C51 TaxID=2824879 RepID=UPI001B3770F6|nr:hypothetical protein [Micromonospora sp. C51]MBQ1052480.1 hypothetical protein [Micromonospora sp. C51]
MRIVRPTPPAPRQQLDIPAANPGQSTQWPPEHTTPYTVAANSPLDSRGDVVMFRDRHGRMHLFRDGHPHGLLVSRQGNHWTLTRERHAHTTSSSGERWDLIAEDAPTCSGGWDTHRREYVARQLPTGRVIARWDTQYGLLARAARYYLGRRGQTTARHRDASTELSGVVAHQDGPRP